MALCATVTVRPILVTAWIVSWSVGSAVFLARSASAQQVRHLSLDDKPAKHDSAFTWIAGIRELADSRVLVADQKENRLVVLDFRGQRLNPDRKSVV